MITNTNLKKWLRHRYGKTPLNEPLGYEIKALELNRDKHAFLRTFNQKEFQSYVGFIDIKGFSDRVKNKSPQFIHDYLSPFLNNVSEEILNIDGMIDKTIGDEIMFILPDMDAESGPPLILRFFDLMQGLRNQKLQLGESYPFRFGMAYGTLILGQIKAGRYSEWTTFGETIHLAKRIMSIGDEEIIDGIFAILKSELKADETFNLIQKYFNCAEPNIEFTVQSRNIGLKGISEYGYAYVKFME